MKHKRNRRRLNHLHVWAPAPLLEVPRSSPGLNDRLLPRNRPRKKGNGARLLRGSRQRRLGSVLRPRVVSVAELARVLLRGRDRPNPNPSLSLKWHRRFVFVHPRALDGLMLERSHLHRLRRRGLFLNQHVLPSLDQSPTWRRKKLLLLRLRRRHHHHQLR